MAEKRYCPDILENLSGYIDAELSDVLCAEIDKHVAECANCRVVVDTLRKTVALYHIQPQPNMPGEVKMRLYKKLDLEAFLPDN